MSLNLDSDDFRDYSINLDSYNADKLLPQSRVVSNVTTYPVNPYKQ